MEVPKKLKEYVDLFASNKEVYKSKAYDEANTRVDFIDKFFALLGWDINNEKGRSENYREVVREDKVVIEGKPKAPDYSFRIGGIRKFFVEAKKPSVFIKEDVSPAFQIRRYAYTAKLPLSILTDFEEFAVYDTRIRPNKNDKASVARVFYCTFDEYEKNWEFIKNTFSEEAIQNGSFDKYVTDNKKKKGTSEVDKEFLKMIDSWRNELAKNIARKNKDISINNLNYAVQKIIDRLIFLRIAEDRNIEEYGKIQSLLTNKKSDIFKELKKFFIEADEKFNSGLFHREDWLEKLEIDDKTLSPIIKQLYYPDCPYEFSVLPVEILGNIYEQFLGKTIRLTKGHQAKVEEKPEVRKAGGVYYTPQYIVEYIINNTVGCWISDVGSWLFDARTLLVQINTNKNDSNKKKKLLQRFRSLAKKHGISEDGLSLNKEVSKRGAVQSDQSNSESSSVDSGKHSRRTGENVSERIHQTPINSQRIISGIGDGVDDSQGFEVSDRAKSWGSLGENAKDRAFIERIASLFTKQQLPKLEQQKSSNSQLTTNIQEPITPKVLDPACGSGSFLIGAYDYLLDYYLKYYSQTSKSRKALKEGRIYETSGGYKLTIQEKKEILLNNIYGVDIDEYAVEVTKLSLLLKLMEDETAETSGQLFGYKEQKILPDLSGNIKCGNSLIGPDFYDQQDLGLFDEEKMRKINVFDWEKEFEFLRSSNFQKGGTSSDAGFDCVIGNPPYLKERDNKEIFEPVLQSEYKKYHQGKMDFWYFFLHKAIDVCKEKGLIGFITNSYFLKSAGASRLIERIKNELFMTKAVDFGSTKVFENVNGKHIVHLYKKKKADKNDRAIYVSNNIQGNVNEENSKQVNYLKMFTSDNKINLENQMEINFDQCVKLEELFDVSTGVQESTDKIGKKALDNIREKDFKVGQGVFVLSKEEVQSLGINTEEKKVLKRYLNSKNMGKYFINFNDEYLIYSDKEIKNKVAQNKYPNIKNHLDNVKKFITSSNKPYGLHRPREQRFFEQPKLICPGMFAKPCFTYDEEKYYVGFSFSVIIKKESTKMPLKVLLAIMNSSLGKYWFLCNGKKRGVGVDIGVLVFRQFPIPKITTNNQQLVTLVDSMLETQKKYHQANTERDQKLLQQKIDILDKQIDKIVYGLYGLTEEEIRIVERN